MLALDSSMITKQRSRGLQLAQKFLDEHSVATTSLNAALTEIARAYRASGVGYVGAIENVNPSAMRFDACGEPLPLLQWPWEKDPEILARARFASKAVSFTHAGM